MPKLVSVKYKLCLLVVDGNFFIPMLVSDRIFRCHVPETKLSNYYPTELACSLVAAFPWNVLKVKRKEVLQSRDKCCI